MRSNIKPLIKLFVLLEICIFSNFAINAQTSDDLRKRFGSPMKEFYQINANVWLNVEYGEDKQLCSVAVNEKYSWNDNQPAFESGNKKTKTEKSATDIYSEMIKNLPSSLSFGKLINDKGSRIGNCFTSNFKEFENVNELFYDEMCANGSPSRSYTIQWKRKECKNINRNLTTW